MLAACALACLALGAGQASARSRQLQQNPPITDFYPEVVEKPESLTTACSIDKWETLLQQGENCVLSAAVVGKFEELQYTFELTADMAKRLSMQIVFEPFEGLAELCVHTRPSLRLLQRSGGAWHCACTCLGVAPRIMSVRRRPVPCLLPHTRSASSPTLPSRRMLNTRVAAGASSSSTATARRAPR